MNSRYATYSCDGALTRIDSEDQRQNDPEFPSLSTLSRSLTGERLCDMWLPLHMSSVYHWACALPLRAHRRVCYVLAARQYWVLRRRPKSVLYLSF